LHFEEHALHCRELSSFKYNIHEFVRDNKPTREEIDSWVGQEQNMHVWTPDFRHFWDWEAFIAGQAAIKATSNKITKHEKTCSDNQHVFILIAFVTFDFLAPKIVSLLQKVQKDMHNNIVTRSIILFLTRLVLPFKKN
jgi:hypothetical protein